MFSLLTLSAAVAGSHSGATAEAITAVHGRTDAPVLIALEGDYTAATWLRLEGWIEAPIQRLLLSYDGDHDAEIAAALASSGLPCAVHLRQTREGWEGALVGQCGTASLPGAMAHTATPIGVSSRWGLPADLSHGFRVGYLYDPASTLVTPHLMVMGYEVTQEVSGGEGLDVLLLGNLSMTGINQSQVYPSLNLQLGVGPSIRWTMPEEETLHMIATAGVVLEAGELAMPLHLSWIPNIDAPDQILLSTGVRFSGQALISALDSH